MRRKQQWEKKGINITFGILAQFPLKKEFQWNKTKRFFVKKKCRQTVKKNAIFRCKNRTQFYIFNANKKRWTFLMYANRLEEMTLREEVVSHEQHWWRETKREIHYPRLNKRMEQRVTWQRDWRTKIFRWYSLKSPVRCGIDQKKILQKCRRISMNVLGAFGKIAHSKLSVGMKCVSRRSLLNQLKCLVKFNTS